MLEWLEWRRIPASITDAARLPGQPERVRSGWPDVTASIPSRLTGIPWAITWLIELKTETGGLQDSQKTLIPQLREDGVLVSIARSLEDAQSQLDAILKEIRQWVRKHETPK